MSVGFQWNWSFKRLDLAGPPFLLFGEIPIFQHHQGIGSSQATASIVAKSLQARHAREREWKAEEQAECAKKANGVFLDLACSLAQEELLCFHKSRTKWIQSGDRNTSYFHATTLIKRRRSKISVGYGASTLSLWGILLLISFILCTGPTRTPRTCL